MKDKQANYILNNLNLLIENTRNTRRLFICMDAFNLLSSCERQILLSFPDDRSRLREMYNVLVQKDVDNYHDLINSLQLSNNESAAKILKEIYGNYPNSIGGNGEPSVDLIENDFPVLQSQVPAIVEILEEVGVSQPEWEQITSNLMGKNCDELMSLPTASIAFKMMRTLDAWVEGNGWKATFSNLLNTIAKTHRKAYRLLLDNSKLELEP